MQARIDLVFHDVCSGHPSDEFAVTLGQFKQIVELAKEVAAECFARKAFQHFVVNGDVMSTTPSQILVREDRFSTLRKAIQRGYEVVAKDIHDLPPLSRFLDSVAL